MEIRGPVAAELSLGILLALAIVVGITTATSLYAKDEDAQKEPVQGLLRKPIPDKLIVLTFDDAPASHATVVAPILKSLGLGGTFYVCDFDSFQTRKDWYLTYRQMQAMAADGFEIGNHTKGHGGGLPGFLAMEDELLAHGCPKPTTICWPVYASDPNIYSDLALKGYSWGRGGYERPYRPAVDNPFDVPSFSIVNGVSVETFIKEAQQACQGRIVVFCFHGVPDMEHPPVSLEPATFKVMMQYLKDNHYKCIAMRELSDYIDPAKAALLPTTPRSVKAETPFETVQDDKPYVAPASGAVIAKPRPAPAKQTAPSPAPAKNILSFACPSSTSVSLAGTSIGMYLPPHADVTGLAPTFTLSPLATAEPVSGTSRDFTSPQTYRITAQDGSTREFTVTAAKTGEPGSFAWSDSTTKNSTAGNSANGSSIVGNWSDLSKWSNNQIVGAPPSPGGKSDYTLSFDKVGNCSLRNDLHGEFQLNRLLFGEGPGVLTFTGNGLTFAKHGVSGFNPVISIGKNRRRITFELPINLSDDLHMQTVNSVDPDNLIAFKGVVSGPGAMILDSYGEPDPAKINGHDAHFGILQFENANTYRGGTVVNGGKLLVLKENGLGSGPIALNDFGTLAANARVSNPVVVNQGRLCDSNCDGPITLKANTDFYGDCNLNGELTGRGGLTMLGKIGYYLGIIPGGTLTLNAPCDYRGPTTVLRGTLVIQQAAGLYKADVTKWTPQNITVHPMATLRLNAGGKDEFTGEQIGVLLTNLTMDVNDNGLLDGSWFSLDTTNAREPVVVAANFTDSKGNQGGPITFKKCGRGTLQLAGANRYSGRTYFEGGTLIVNSFNSIEGRKPSSSLGAPTTLENGIIDCGGDCTFRYVGLGETTDRVLDLNGQKQTVTFDQSGSGLLKFTSPFDISGYGFDKTIVLQGSSAGSGEFAAKIADPYDRKRTATTAVTKNGTGRWTLSDENTYTGPTTVAQGTLMLTKAHGLSAKAEVRISEGAKLELDFSGQMTISKLVLDGQTQPAGDYNGTRLPNYLAGKGVLKVQP